MKYHINFCGQEIEIYSNTTHLDRDELDPLTKCNIIVKTPSNFFFLTVQTIARGNFIKIAFYIIFYLIINARIILAPGKIKNLKSTSYTNMIYLWWEEPTRQYDTIQNYLLEYWVCTCVIKGFQQIITINIYAARKIFKL